MKFLCEQSIKASACRSNKSAVATGAGKPVCSFAECHTHTMHKVMPWILVSHVKKGCVRADGKPPLVNVTSLNISHIDYGRIGLESTSMPRMPSATCLCDAVKRCWCHWAFQSGPCVNVGRVLVDLIKSGICTFAGQVSFLASMDIMTKLLDGPECSI